MTTRLSRPEWAVLATCAVLLLVALLAPGVTQPADYHGFADQRGWGGIPHALNVLSNLPFAIGGVWGLWALQRAPRAALLPVERSMAALFFAGLVLTSFCSGWYHWLPNNAGLALDRLGMAVAFAGLLGLAAADRISARAGHAVGWGVLVLALLSVAVSAVTGTVLPWGLVQRSVIYYGTPEQSEVRADFTHDFIPVAALPAGIFDPQQASQPTPAP